MDPSDPTIPVEITHPSGVRFRLNLTGTEISRFYSDEIYQQHLVDKYFSLYQDGIVTAIDENTDPEASTSGSGHTTPRQRRIEDEEMLIKLVSERPPLFDFRLPLKERGRIKIQNLWEEILLEMKVDMSVEAISKNWKNLRDSYIRARANITKKIASGSSAEEKLQAEKLKKNHRNYQLFSFLTDTLNTRRTYSNLEDKGDINDQPPSPIASLPSTPSSTPRHQASTDEMFLNAIREMPRPPNLSATQNFCFRLADGLEKLPPQISNKLQLEFLTKLTEMENLYVYQ